MYQAVLFDLDDTLYDFRTFWRGRIALGLAPIQQAHPELDDRELTRAIEDGWIFAEKFVPFLRTRGVADELLLEQAHRAYTNGWFDGVALPEESLAVLQQLRPAYRLGLITNGPASTQRPKIVQFALETHMDVLLVSGEEGIAKPDAGIFARALERLGVDADRALFVGDSPTHDLAGAQAAGIDAVWFNPRGDILPAQVAPPVAEIRRLPELFAVLERRC